MFKDLKMFQFKKPSHRRYARKRHRFLQSKVPNGYSGRARWLIVYDTGLGYFLPAAVYYDDNRLKVCLATDTLRRKMYIHEVCDFIVESANFTKDEVAALLSKELGSTCNVVAIKSNLGGEWLEIPPPPEEGSNVKIEIGDLSGWM